MTAQASRGGALVSGPWSPEEIDFLTSAWGVHSASEIAHFIGRGRGAVCAKAQRLGLSIPEPYAPASFLQEDSDV